ncbi:MAG: hypothetical protein WBM50_05455 [Acidimicrobiales bacterium]
MNRHHGLRPLRRADSIVGNRRGVLAVALLASGIVLGACSDDASEMTGSNESPVAVEDDAGPIADAGNDRNEVADGLTFRDPADDGFAPVVDNEVEPVGDETTPDPTAGDPAPEDVIADITDQLSDGPADGDILDSVDVLDHKTDVADERDGRSRNSSGEPVTLDEAANLACAHGEIAISQLDAGQNAIALERIATAGQFAGQSGQPSIRVWVEPLSGVIVDGKVVDVAPLIGFLSVCTDGGYEL